VEYRLTIPQPISFRFDLQTNRGTDSGGISEIELTINGSAFETLTESPSNIVVENSLGTTLGSKVGTDWQIADITVTDSDGTTSSVAAGVNVTCTPQVKSLTAYFNIHAISSTTDLITVDANNLLAGTYTATTDDGASGTITFSINGAAYAAFTNPTTLALTDTIRIQRTVTTADGWVKLTGTYE
jgi:hypothetical protein